MKASIGDSSVLTLIMSQNLALAIRSDKRGLTLTLPWTYVTGLPSDRLPKCDPV